jgi:hypothetical protein
MSKFLLNLLVQISKVLVYSKIKFYSEKNFPHFRPNRPSSQPAHPGFQPSHDPLLLSFSTNCFPPPHWASASRPAQPACASMAPHPVAAFFMGKHLQPSRLCPSPHPADGWALPVIPNLRLRLTSAASPPPPAAPVAPHSSAPRDAARAVTAPPSLPLNPPPS